MTIFNPTIHASLIDNLRRGYKDRYNLQLSLSDKAIYDIWNEWCLVESEDTTDKELPIYEALLDASN